jgi:CBS domain containing-hemolysin-like protein
MSFPDGALAVAAAALLFFLLAAALGAFARSLDRLGALGRRAFSEEHSGAARALLEEPAGDAALRTAIGAQRAAAFVVAAILFHVSLVIGGALSPTTISLGVGVAIVASTEFLLSLLVSRGRAVRTLVVVAPIVRLVVSPLLPLVSRIVDRPEDGSEAAGEKGPADPGEEEVRAFLDLGRDEGILEEKESQLVESIVDFGDRVVREVMTPRIDMVALPVSTPLAQLSARFVETKLSRIPLYRDSIDQIVGIVHVQELLQSLVGPGPRPATAEPLAQTPFLVPDSARLDWLLGELQEKSLQMAIVVDEYGGVAGLVTLEDLLEEIVGEIGDEHEPAGAEEIVELSAGVWRLLPRCRPQALAEIAGHQAADELDSPEFDTVAGLVASRLGRIAVAGDSIRVGEVQLLVEEVDRQRIKSLRATRVEGPETPAKERT